MKTIRPSFIVEVKFKRRRQLRKKSIWGDTDFKALVNEAAATAPEVFVTNDVPKESVDLAASAIAIPTGQIYIGGGSPNKSPLLSPTEIVPDHTPNATFVKELSSDPAVERTAKRSRRKQIASGSGQDELAALGEENLQLKLLLKAKLESENRLLGSLLSRFIDA